MTRPVRLQLSRRKGFSLQEHSRAVNGLPAAKVSRPGPFGNPFTIGDAATVFDCRVESAHHHAVTWFRQWIECKDDEAFSGLREYFGTREQRDRLIARLPELAGKNLACFCKPGLACHADVLLELANGFRCEAQL